MTARYFKENVYILYRKIKALISSVCFYLCRIFPVKDNRISVCTFEGKGGFGCNPKYIVEELHRRNQAYEFVWFVNDMTKVFPKYIRKVPNTLWNRAFWLSTSKIWIDNYRKPYGTCKRRNQYYLNTNHYSIAMKSTGLWRGKGFSRMAYLVSKNDSDMIDDIVIDSKWCEDSFYKSLVYRGTYLNTGLPRCDVLYGDRKEYHNQFCKKHDIPLEAKILMYAPTFRESVKNGKRSVFSAVWTIDFGRVLKNLEKRFGGKWYLCVRMHPQLSSFIKKYKNDDIQKILIDETQADDMYEILAGMDVYMTDYSSAMFEAGFAGIPVFIYMDDLEQYSRERGSLMWDIADGNLKYIKNNKCMTPNIDVIFPFSVAQNNDELEKNILEFEYILYRERINQLSKTISLVFDGKASERVADKLQGICSNEII